MRDRSLLCSCLAATSFFLAAACSPAVNSPEVMAADGAATASPSASAAATATAAPLAVATSAPVAEPPPPPVSPETLAKLPPDAAAYVSVRLGPLAQAMAANPRTQRLLGDLSRELDGLSPEALVAAGVDPRRAILAALSSGGFEKSAGTVLDTLSAGSAGSAPKGLAKLLQDHNREATLVRLLVPLTSGTTPAAAAASLLPIIAHGAVMERRPAAADGKDLGADAMLGVARSAHVGAVAYADGADLRIDVALPLFVEATSSGALAALTPFGTARGGFTGRCARFDPAATVSLCLDARGLGDMATTRGYGMTAQALAGGGLDPAQLRKIAAAGRTESRRNLELAAPARKLAADGTLVASLSGDHPSIVWSWALADSARPAVEKAFATERCAQGPAILAELVPALRAAFGDPGPGFTDPRKVFQSFREAGWGAYAVTLAGTWPNLLDTFGTSGRNTIAIPLDTHLCVRAEGGRLALSFK